MDERDLRGLSGFFTGNECAALKARTGRDDCAGGPVDGPGRMNGAASDKWCPSPRWRITVSDTEKAQAASRGHAGCMIRLHDSTPRFESCKPTGPPRFGKGWPTGNGTGGQAGEQKPGDPGCYRVAKKHRDRIGDPPGPVAGSHTQTT